MWKQFLENLLKWLNNLGSGSVTPAPVPPAPPVTPPTSPSGPSTSVQEELLAAHNAERARGGLAPLRLHPLLNAAAQKFAERMARLGQMSHTAGGDTFSQRIAAEGYKSRGGGENIAMGYRDVPAVMSGWMHSPGHRANILGQGYVEVGFGAFRDNQGRMWWCANFAIPGAATRTVSVMLPGPLKGPDA
jgi:uncharacterized protein YkwD